MKPQSRLQVLSAAVGCAAVAVMGALSVAATGQSSAQPGGTQSTTSTVLAPVGSHAEVTTTTPSTAMSFRPLVTATVPPPPT